MYETSIDGFSIRHAVPTDVPLILQFIRDLAEYEKLAHEVVVNEQDLQRHLFSEDARAEVLIAEQDQTPVGFALYFHNFSTFLGRPGIYLEDLFVSPQYRGQGYGKALLTCLASIAVSRNCGRLEWSVLDWNQPAIDFYEALGATTMKGWLVNRVTGAALTQMAEKFKVI